MFYLCLRLAGSRLIAATDTEAAESTIVLQPGVSFPQMNYKQWSVLLWENANKGGDDSNVKWSLMAALSLRLSSKHFGSKSCEEGLSCHSPEVNCLSGPHVFYHYEYIPRQPATRELWMEGLVTKKRWFQWVKNLTNKSIKVSHLTYVIATLTRVRCICNINYKNSSVKGYNK